MFLSRFVEFVCSGYNFDVDHFSDSFSIIFKAKCLIQTPIDLVQYFILKKP